MWSEHCPILHILTYSTLKIKLRNRNYHHIHFKHEETETQRSNIAKTIRRQSQCSVCSLFIINCWRTGIVLVSPTMSSKDPRIQVCNIAAKNTGLRVRPSAFKSWFHHLWTVPCYLIPLHVNCLFLKRRQPQVLSLSLWKTSLSPGSVLWQAFNKCQLSYLNGQTGGE